MGTNLPSSTKIWIERYIISNSNSKATGTTPPAASSHSPAPSYLPRLHLLRLPPPSKARNPNAPIFVPLAYQTVEDFSDQWWNLIHSSPCFHDYWLRERFSDEDIFLSDDLEINEENSFNFTPKGEEKETNFWKELVSIEALKWRRGKTVSELSRKMEKAPKIVNVKESPRPIQQPR